MIVKSNLFLEFFVCNGCHALSVATACHLHLLWVLILKDVPLVKQLIIVERGVSSKACITFILFFNGLLPLEERVAVWEQPVCMTSTTVVKHFYSYNYISIS